MTITEETRLKSYIQRPTPRQADILKYMDDRELTARQIARGMGYNDMNAIRPRLSELKLAGKVEVVGHAYDTLTDRSVAVWRAI